MTTGSYRWSIEILKWYWVGFDLRKLQKIVNDSALFHNDRPKQGRHTCMESVPEWARSAFLRASVDTGAQHQTHVVISRIPVPNDTQPFKHLTCTNRRCEIDSVISMYIRYNLKLGTQEMKMQICVSSTTCCALKGAPEGNVSSKVSLSFCKWLADNVTVSFLLKSNLNIHVFQGLFYWSQQPSKWYQVRKASLTTAYIIRPYISAMAIKRMELAWIYYWVITRNI